MKTIKIKLDSENYYEHVLKILKAVPPFDKLKQRELEVYSRLLFHYNKLKTTYPSETFEQINNRIFNYDCKKLIEEDLGMTEAAFRNKLLALRQCNIIDSKSLKKHFIVTYAENIEFKFIN